MNDIELRLRGAWNNLEGIVTDLLAAGYERQAGVISKCAATVRTLQSQMTTASELLAQSEPGEKG